jgi:hypothetical protein
MTVALQIRRQGHHAERLYRGKLGDDKQNLHPMAFDIPQPVTVQNRSPTGLVDRAPARLGSRQRGRFYGLTRPMLLIRSDRHIA